MCLTGKYPVLQEADYYRGSTGSLLPGIPRKRLYLASSYRD